MTGTALNLSNRDRALAAVEAERFDMLVIGGGITGAGIARDAATRGLRVALIEARDFASGTSSRSTKLIHGGLRYLAQGDIGLVREAARERTILQRIAPHLAARTPLILPTRTRADLIARRAGLMLYERLGQVPRSDHFEAWSAERLKTEEPALRTEGLIGAVVYPEYVTDDARLVIANVRSAVAAGAVVANYLAAEEFILETEDLTKEFAGFTAVGGVDLHVRRGTIHALIGPNGAGKTTCFNLLTKFLSPTRGRILFKGSDITAMQPADVARLGLVRSFQISAVFPHMSVLENVRIALQRARGGSFDFWRSTAVLNKFNERAMELIADVGLTSFTDWMAVELPYGRKRALEIATTLALDPEMLLLDEPTAGMGHEDIDRIAQLIKRVAADRTVLMVEHNLSVVADLSDTITVLTRGRILAEGNYETVSSNPDVREAYMGVGHA